MRRCGFIRYLLHGLARHADGKHTCRYILRHNAACADDGVITDGDARANLHAHANPDVIADGDRLGIFQSGVALCNIERMACGRDTAVRADEHMVADGDRRRVQNHKVMVGIKCTADTRMAAVIDKKTAAQ